MNIVDDIKPISFLKQKTSEVVKRIKKTKQPTFITINGNVELVLQDANSYQNMMDYINSMNNANQIIQSVNEIERGEGLPFKETFTKLRKKHKLY